MDIKRSKISTSGESTRDRRILSKAKPEEYSTIKLNKTNKLLKRIVIINWIVIFVLLGIVIYTYSSNKHALFISIKDWKIMTQYEKIIKKREEYIKTNKELDNSNSDLYKQIQDSSISFEQKVLLFNTFISQTEKIQENMKAIMELYNQLDQLPLIDSLKGQISEIKAQDMATMSQLDNSLNYFEAQSDYLDLRNFNESYEKCIQNIDLSKSEKEISQAFKSCNNLATKVKEKLTEIESKYGVSLPTIKQYVEYNIERWSALGNFYNAVQEENFKDEKKYDDIYFSKTEEIKKITQNNFWIEYKEKILLPLEPE